MFFFFWKNKNQPAAETWAQCGFAINEDKDRHTEAFRQMPSAFATFHVKAGADTKDALTMTFHSA